jgi:hypothetical protein
MFRFLAEIAYFWDKATEFHGLVSSYTIDAKICHNKVKCDMVFLWRTVDSVTKTEENHIRGLSAFY